MFCFAKLSIRHVHTLLAVSPVSVNSRKVDTASDHLLVTCSLTCFVQPSISSAMCFVFRVSNVNVLMLCCASDTISYQVRYGTASALTRPSTTGHARPFNLHVCLAPRNSAIILSYGGLLVLPCRPGMSSPLSWSVFTRPSRKKEGRGSRSASPSIVLTTCCTLLRTGLPTRTCFRSVRERGDRKHLSYDRCKSPERAFHAYSWRRGRGRGYELFGYFHPPVVV